MKKIFLRGITFILLLSIIACSKGKTETLRVGMDLRFYPFYRD